MLKLGYAATTLFFANAVHAYMATHWPNYELLPLIVGCGIAGAIMRHVNDWGGWKSALGSVVSGAVGAPFLYAITGSWIESAFSYANIDSGTALITGAFVFGLCSTQIINRVIDATKIGGEE